MRFSGGTLGAALVLLQEEEERGRKLCQAVPRKAMWGPTNWALSTPSGRSSPGLTASILILDFQALKFVRDKCLLLKP